LPEIPAQTAVKYDHLHQLEGGERGESLAKSSPVLERHHPSIAASKHSPMGKFLIGIAIEENELR
jgi:hypothetical protein